MYSGMQHDLPFRHHLQLPKTQRAKLFTGSSMAPGCSLSSISHGRAYNGPSYILSYYFKDYFIDSFRAQLPTTHNTIPLNGKASESRSLGPPVVFPFMLSSIVMARVVSGLQLRQHFIDITLGMTL